MSEEELEKTGTLQRVLINLEEEDMTIDEMIEEFLENVDFLNISDSKKDNLKRLCAEIQEESDENVKEYLFKLLIKEANSK
ncbi:MAG: hypothetical protein E7160_04320 [Firmicutes bacterium]|nr:hypothetical protein [Bacillota bacterium]